MICDMTEGKPSRMLWRFTIPLLLSVIFQQLYNVVDSIVAGQFVGSDALAAVGSSYPITMIFMAVATGANIGCSVVISQLFGAKELGKMKTAIHTSLIAICVVAALLTGVGFVICQPLMRLLQTPENIFADAALYLQIYIGGLLFLFLYNICTGVFTALGDSRTPLYFLIGSSLGNIFLDIWFVTAFDMGVGGVAWATFLAQGVACVLAFITLMHRLRYIYTNEPHKAFSFSMLKRIAIVAIPSILQQSFISVGNLLIQGLVNSYGSDVIAGYSAAVKLNTFSVTCFTTLANGLSSFTAQNIGAGKVERVQKGFKAGILMSICVVIPFIIAFFFFSPYMIRIFVSNAPAAVLSSGSEFLKIVSPFYVFVMVKLMADGVLRGSGAMVPFMITTFSDLIIRVGLSYLLAWWLNSSVGIWLSWPIGWAIATVMSYVFYKSGIWKKKVGWVEQQ